MTATQERPYRTVVRKPLIESIGRGPGTGYELSSLERKSLNLSAFQFLHLQTGVD